MTSAQRILITGAAGSIGTALRARLAKDGRILRLLDIVPIEDPSEREEVVYGSVTDPEAVEQACKDVDVVVHLAGGASVDLSWQAVVEVNIGGTQSIFEGSRKQGVKRVVFASSNHAVGFYPRGRGSAGDYIFPRPDSFYGVGKVAGEALGAFYHDRYGLDVVCIRIGTFAADGPPHVRALSTWLSPDDAGRLFEACISTPNPGFRVIWGVSANTRGWFSLEEAATIGYRPQDDAERYVEQLNGREVTPGDNDFVGGHIAVPFDQLPK